MRETGALWEIKPEGSEILGQAQALGYVTELGSANVAAHLGNKIGDDALGASGSLDYLIYRVSFSASEPGLITYRVVIRPELNLLPSAAGAAAGAAAAASWFTKVAPLLVIP
jgi:hypothetical protein